MARVLRNPGGMVLKFSDLFEGLGTAELRFGSRCPDYSGQEVEIRGWLAQAHDGSRTVMLVNRPGDCPDCSATPVAAVILPGFRLPKHAIGAITLCAGGCPTGSPCATASPRTCAWSGLVYRLPSRPENEFGL
jgi:hypothetical protein